MSSENYPKLIQFMISRGCVLTDELSEFLVELKGSQISDEDFGRAIGKANQKLSKYNMRLVSSLDKKTLKSYHSLISTVDNEVSHKAIHHSPKEFEYFKLIWQELIRQPNNEDDMETIKRIATQKGINNYSDLLEEWHRKHWLVLEDDTVRLGPRAVELEVLIPREENSTIQESD